MNSIFTRRSVRRFSDRVVEQEKIELLLRAAMQAPSASNQQPWQYIVVQGKENLEKLSKFNPYSSSLRYANLGIIVLADTNRFNMPEFVQQDLAASTQNILLEVTELELGAVWYGTMPHQNYIDYIRDFCDLPENLIPFSVLGIGYPARENANNFIDRYDENRVRYIR